VVHTRVDRPLASREPLQFGAEIYGHAGLEADLEAVELLSACLRHAGVHRLQLDLADVRVIDAVLAPVQLPADHVRAIHVALAGKDVPGLGELAQSLPGAVRCDRMALPGLFGDVSVIARARDVLSASPALLAALDDLQWLADQAKTDDMTVSIDLADLRGYAYYTGMRFAVFAQDPQGSALELARGGRYDEVGAVFGRKRPAVGFSLDLKELVSAVAPRPLVAAIRSPWGMAPGLRKAVAELRVQGHTVVCVLPGHEHEVNEFHCDRELVPDAALAGGWTVKSL
jgi:ATP phosphoribosyltransferase regulatory subunit